MGNKERGKGKRKREKLASEGAFFFGFDGRRFADDFFLRLRAGAVVLFAEDDHADGGDEDEQAGDFKRRDVGRPVRAGQVGGEEELADFVRVVGLHINCRDG